MPHHGNDNGVVDNDDGDDDAAAYIWSSRGDGLSPHTKGVGVPHFPTRRSAGQSRARYLALLRLLSRFGDKPLDFRVLLRGAIVNRTYGTHKNLYISLFLQTIYDPIYYGPP